MTAEPEAGIAGTSAHLAPEQVRALNTRLDRRLLKRNPEGKSYIEGYSVINALNRIVGYGAWSREVLARWCEDPQDGDSGLLFGASVRLIVTAPDGTQSHHDDDGYCIAPAARSTGKVSLQARETARKGAVTDALKRAARDLGEQFANNLYDKDYMITRAADDREAAASAQAEQPTRQPTPLRLTPGSGTVADVAPSTREQLMAAISPLLRDDPDAAAKLTKELDDHSDDELRKLHAWLNRRKTAGKARGQAAWSTEPQAAEA